MLWFSLFSKLNPISKGGIIPLCEGLELFTVDLLSAF
jgi:hypothetical protein